MSVTVCTMPGCQTSAGCKCGTWFARWERTIKMMPRDKRPAQPDPLVLTTHTEIIFGGFRLSPGTYQVRKIDNDEIAEPNF